MKKSICVGLVGSLALVFAGAAVAQKHLDVPADRAGYSCNWLAGGGLRLSVQPNPAADVRLIVDFDDTLDVNGSVTNLDALKPLLASAAEARDGMLAVQIEPHPMGERQRITRVVEAVNAAGVIPACRAARPS